MGLELDWAAAAYPVAMELDWAAVDLEQASAAMEYPAALVEQASADMEYPAAMAEQDWAACPWLTRASQTRATP